VGSINFNVGFAGEVENKGFLYKDLKVPFNLSKNLVDSLIDSDCIKNGLKNIFLWNKGERILNPRFGSPLPPYLHEPMNDNIKKNLQAAVRNAIETWEPRVTVTSINIDEETDDNTYYIEIVYFIPVLNVTDQIIIANN